MKPPKRLIIGNRHYRVISSGKVAALATDIHEKSGVTDHDRLTIAVSSVQHPANARDCLLHEALHGICDEYGISTWLGSTEEEEQLIRMLSPALLALLRNNRKLVPYLTEDDA